MSARMHRRYPTTATLLVDTAEQKPLDIPSTLRWHSCDGRSHRLKLRCERVKLPTADYALLEGFPEGRVVRNRAGTRTVEPWDPTALLERKLDWTELQKNLVSADWRRFRDVLDRMADEALHRAIAIEKAVPPGPTRYCPDPIRVLDKLLHETSKRDIQIVWLPRSTAKHPYAAGEYVVRWLWMTHYTHNILARQE